MVAQPDARREPGAVVVHLEDTAAACRAVVGAVGLSGLTFLAEASLAVGFDSKGARGALFAGREGAVPAIVGGTTGRSENGGGVGPVEKSV